MYHPRQPGVPRVHKQFVIYEEFLPDTTLRETVYCFWRLYTTKTLTEDFQYLVLPDGCIDIVFDITNTPVAEGALVMTPSITAERLNLGSSFSYIGIRLQPGSWLASPLRFVGKAVPVMAFGGFDLSSLRRQLADTVSEDQALRLNQAVIALSERHVITKSLFTLAVTQQPDLKVDDFAASLGYSRRHVQRLLKEHLGYRPQDFIKVLRFQYALNGDRAGYADQPHYIREFKRITGMTPTEFYATY